MTTDEIRDTLLEARRYAATDPDEAARLCEEALDEIISTDEIVDAPEAARDDGGDAWLERLHNNLHVGLKFLRADPEAFRSYCYAAAFELGLGADPERTGRR